MIRSKTEKCIDFFIVSFLGFTIGLFIVMPIVLICSLVASGIVSGAFSLIPTIAIFGSVGGLIFAVGNLLNNCGDLDRKSSFSADMGSCALWFILGGLGVGGIFTVTFFSLSLVSLPVALTGLGGMASLMTGSIVCIRYCSNRSNFVSAHDDNKHLIEAWKLLTFQKISNESPLSSTSTSRRSSTSSHSSQKDDQISLDKIMSQEKPPFSYQGNRTVPRLAPPPNSEHGLELTQRTSTSRNDVVESDTSTQHRI